MSRGEKRLPPPIPKTRVLLVVRMRGRMTERHSKETYPKLKPPVPDVPKFEYDIDFIKQEANSNI